MQELWLLVTVFSISHCYNTLYCQGPAEQQNPQGGYASVGWGCGRDHGLPLGIDRCDDVGTSPKPAGWAGRLESQRRVAAEVCRQCGRGILFGERGQYSKKIFTLEPMRLCVIGSNLPFSESIL